MQSFTTDVVKVYIHDVILSENGFVVLLRPQEGFENKALFVLIGFSEAQLLTVQFNKIPTTRPLIIDVINNLFYLLKLKITKVTISEVVDQVFYSKIYFEGKNKTNYLLDARTSDALILAISHNADIFVTKSILEEKAVFYNFQEEDEYELAQYKSDRIQILKEDLMAAVNEERYEEAARIRDEIKKIKGEGH